jgi:hypothetical protein
MPDHKRPLKVFLCHTHADRGPVRGLPAGTRLTQDGVDAYFKTSGQRTDESKEELRDFINLGVLLFVFFTPLKYSEPVS